MKHRGSFPIGWTPLTDTTDKDTNERTDGRTNSPSVRPSLRWSLTLFWVRFSVQAVHFLQGTPLILCPRMTTTTFIIISRSASVACDFHPPDS